MDKECTSTDKIRVLHVAQAAGGVERYLHYFLKNLDRKRFENVLVCSQDYCAEAFNGYVVGLEQIEMHRTIGKADLKVALKIRNLIKRYKPDVVYAHSSKAGAIARIANLGLKSRCIYNPHGWAFNMRGTRKKQFIYAMLERIMAPFCDQIICISDAERDAALEKKICRENKLKVIFNGIDIESYEEVESRRITKANLGIPEDSFVVGMVGRLSEQKAPDVFIRMAKIIKEQVEKCYFIIVGNGEMETDVRELANKFDVDVLITGWVEHPLDYVALFDVAVLLSRWEGFGLAIPEYMLAGKPVVATNIDAIPNLVTDGVNGLLVDVDDAMAACNAVLRLKNDVELREKIVKQSMIDVRERFDCKRVSAEHEKLFEIIRFKNRKRK